MVSIETFSLFLIYYLSYFCYPNIDTGRLVMIRNSLKQKAKGSQSGTNFTQTDLVNQANSHISNCSIKTFK